MPEGQKIKNRQRGLRQRRTRCQIRAKSKRPRLSVFRSAKHFYLQIIDDNVGRTLCAASDSEVAKDKKAIKPLEKATAVGTLLAKKALEKKIGVVVFDRGSYQYHGRVKAAAEAARAAGLKF